MARADRKSLSNLSSRRPGLDPSQLEELEDRVEKLEQRGIGLDELPVAKLQRKLEQTWQPDGSVLLAPKSIGLESLSSDVFASESWIAPTLINSWANQGGAGNPPAGYYKDSFGIVHLRGYMNGAAATSAIMFNLPTGYRPSYNLIFPLTYWDAAAWKTGAFYVNADGNVNAHSEPHGIARSDVQINVVNFKAA